MTRGGDGKGEGTRGAASGGRGPMRDACAALALGLLAGMAVGLRATGRRRRDEREPTAGSTFDVTQREDAESALRRAAVAAETARDDAERASAAMRETLAEIGHEIRIPLTGLLRSVDQLAAAERLPPDLLRNAEAARSAGHALRGIADDIRDLQGIEAGRIALHSAPFSLAALVGGCLSMVRGEATANGLDLRHSQEDGLPPIVIGDEARLRRVLLALIGHAVRCARGGAITVSVLRDAAGRSVAARSEAVRFVVAEAGIGTAPGAPPAPFAGASGVDGSIGRAPGGRRPGLAIATRLVEAMGGEMHAAPREAGGAGAAFTVVLPRGVASASLAAIPRATIAPRRGRLLLVEDLPINQQLARVVLEAAGHAVDVVGDGTAAVAAVARGPYDLVLMDVRMPGMDGLTAARAIRALPGPAGRVPILAMTANVSPDEVSRCLAAGMNDHVGKPFDRGALYARIDRWLPDGSSAAIPMDEPSHDTAVEPSGELLALGDPFDRGTFEGVVALLGVDDTRRLLGQLEDELGRSLHGPSESGADRARLRREAHVLVSAAGMLGLTGLRAACLRFEACTPATPAFPAELAALRARIETGKQDARRLAEALRPAARALGSLRA